MDTLTASETATSGCKSGSIESPNPQLVSFYKPELDLDEIMPTLEAENESFYAFAFSRMIHAADKSKPSIATMLKQSQMATNNFKDRNASSRESTFFAYVARVRCTGCSIEQGCFQCVA